MASESPGGFTGGGIPIPGSDIPGTGGRVSFQIIFVDGIPLPAPNIDWMQLFQDLIQSLTNLFKGRPREEATIQVASRLQRSPNFAAQLYGAELMRLLHTNGIVISDSSPGGQAQLGKAFHQFVQNLEAQGVTLKRARTIALDSLSREAQAGKPLEKEIAKPVAGNLVLLGSQSLQNLSDHYREEAQLLQKLPGKVGPYIIRQLVDHAKFSDLTDARLGPPPPVFPGAQPGDGGHVVNPTSQFTWPTLTLPPADPNCQGSYSLDPNTNTYTPTPYCGVVPAGYRLDAANGVATPDTPPTDEIQAQTADQTYALAAIAYYLKTAAAQLATPATPATPQTSDCCDRIAAVLEKLTAPVSPSVAANAGEQVTIPPPDLAGVITELTRIADFLEGQGVSLEQPPAAATTMPANCCEQLRDLVARIADATERAAAAINPAADDYFALLTQLHKETLLSDEMYALLSSGGQP